ncbi:MAG TPA: ankyrin repeat domain-containing protein [Terracidiphilus sp.]|nr:ankyrin repeat domain-containing protein [Terracidiphilus sp.]
MSQKQLPHSPDINQYKKQAKELARACRAGLPEALERMREHHPRHVNQQVSGPASQHVSEAVKLAEAQLVLAREHGFASWPKFAAEVERRRITRAVDDVGDPVDAFLRAALVPRGTAHVSGTLEEAEAIRARYPQVERANLYTAAVLGDDAAVQAALEHADAATRKGGPYGWEPLLHVCFSRYLRLDQARTAGFERASRMLLEAGADANGGWYEKPDYEGGPEVWESAMYGAAGLAQSAGVTRALLEHGADPNDGETPYHVPEGYDNTVMEILLQSGKLTERSKSWLLARKADWHDYDGMKMALEHGADPNLIPRWGRSALQHAVQRDNRIEMLRLLLEHAADPQLPNAMDRRTAAQMAARHGRGDFLVVLDEMGIDPKLTGVDRLIAACARGEGAAAAAMAGETPALREALLAEGGELLGAFAGVGNTDGVRCLLDLGVAADAVYGGDAYFDEAKDSTALHVAAWRGWPETARLLIARGTPVDAKDGKGRTALQLAVKACTDSYWKGRRRPEWIAVLVEAGASVEGIAVPTGYAEGDEVLKKQVSKSAS